MNPRRLFLASCVALVATAMTFAIRGDIMSDFERDFALSKSDVGWIAGAAFWGFGLSILLGGPLCDLLGMGTLMGLAATGHIAGTLATVAAPNFLVLFGATLVIGIANGLVEAAINPLVATIYNHNAERLLQRGEILKRVPFDKKEVGPPAHGNRAKFVFLAEEDRRVNRGSANDIVGCEAAFPQQLQLAVK